ncbi:deoxyribose-phosphate aldolase [bacterium]|nr:MAG: deoxyribose-phosphate aldolase [bacterium]
MTRDEVARTIDHAVLQPTMTDDDLRREIESVRPFPLASVCVKPTMVPLAGKLLEGTAILVSTVVGFPHGSPTPATKAFEAREAIEAGAKEIDMVANPGKAVERDEEFIRRDIGGVLDACRAGGALLKVILETGLHDDDTKRWLCGICSDLGVDFVKTSTGFGTVKWGDGLKATGATEHDVELMRAACPPSVGVKASGGVRNFETAVRMLELGATRLGTGSTVAILTSDAAGAGSY